MSFMFKRFGGMELVLLGSIALCFGLFLLFATPPGIGAKEWGGPAALAAYYAQGMGIALANYAYYAYIGFFIIVFGLIIAGNFKTFPIVAILKKILRAAAAVCLAIFFLIIASFVVNEANAFNRNSLHDAAVIGWDRALTGHYVFAALGSVTYPHLFIVFVIGSFASMSFILIIAGLCVGYEHPELLRELISAFCIGIIMMMAVWLALPALSPQDRFIDNVYHLPVPPDIASTVASYHPQREIEDFLANVRAEKNASGGFAPTSTIPSAHVFWAVLAGYYLFRSRKLLGWIALPFLLASSFGTVLLAQHYFADVPLGIVAAFLAILLARFITRWDDYRRFP